MGAVNVVKFVHDGPGEDCRFLVGGSGGLVGVWEYDGTTGCIEVVCEVNVRTSVRDLVTDGEVRRREERRTGGAKRRSCTALQYS